MIMTFYWCSVLIYLVGVLSLAIKMIKDPRLNAKMEEENEMEEEYGRKEEVAFPVAEVLRVVGLTFVPFLNLIAGIAAIAVVVNNEMWEQIVDMLLRGF